MNVLIEEMKPFMFPYSLSLPKDKDIKDTFDFLKPKQKLPLLENKLSLDLISIQQKNKVEKVDKVDKVEKVDKVDKRYGFFYPKQRDTLFWCFYIIHYGFEKYEYPHTTSFAKEKEEKFHWINVLREKKHLLKEKKLKNVKEDVENELGNKERITMKTFLALCIVEKINILFVHKRKCFVLDSSEGEPYHVIHCLDKNNKNSGYAYEMDTTPETWKKYKEEYFLWASFEKPIKAPTAYKVDELVKMAKQLTEGDVPVTKGKKELYEYILSVL
jgi:hypothetical protein